MPVTLVGDVAANQSSLSDPTHLVAGQIEIEIANARMTVIGMVTPELAQALMATLRGRR